MTKRRAQRAAEPEVQRLPIRVRDENGRASGVRLRILDSFGRPVAPLGHMAAPEPTSRSAGDVILGDGEHRPFEVHALIYDGAEVDLLPGRYSMVGRKGFEYEPVQSEFVVGDSEAKQVSVDLPRIEDLSTRGWYPGDNHVHTPDPFGVRYEMECEGLRVCSLLVLKYGLGDAARPGDGAFWNVEHFTGALSPASDADHLIQVGEEFRHRRLAHLVMQNIDSLVWPVSTGGPPENGPHGHDWPLMFHASEAARSRGGAVSWAHWPYPSLEAPLDIALGQIDSIDLLTVGDPFDHHPELVEIYGMYGPAVYSMPPVEVYYAYLNCGFRLAVSGGSDKMRPYPPLGSARTYVGLDGPLEYGAWVDGIRRGRTFVTNGPLLELSVGGCQPGDTLAVPSTPARLHVAARAISVEPYDTLELVHNGDVIRAAAPSGRRNEATIDGTVEVTGGGWIAARAHGRTMLEYGPTWRRMPVFAHTSPIYLDARGRPLAAGRSARLLLEQLETFRRWIKTQANLPGGDERREAIRLADRARAIYRRIATSERP